MTNFTRQRMVIQLNIAQDNGDPTIFLWSVLPEQIVKLNKSTSGGTDVTFKLPNGEQITLLVTQDVEQIRQAIEICNQKDEIMN